ncbi:MAG: Gfo/Idh/MocA family oxidoreductase [Devosia sp.]|nr:Gfo/Idh/MocA family oxidoreductase [Devosia sp.]
MSQARVAIIGVGRMGMRHASVVGDLGLSLEAVSDILPDALSAAGTKLGLGADRQYTDPFRLIDEVRPEVLIVSTTAPTHRDLVVHAARSGVRAVLCEKPAATSIAACDAMIEACLDSGTRLAINHQMRFMEQYQKPRDLVNSPAYGGLGSVIVSAGNFGMAMNGTHYFEMFRYLTDEAPVSVNAWFSPEALPNPRGPQFIDAAGSVRMTTASGKRFYLDCSPDQGHGMFVTYNCRNGRIDIDELSGQMTMTVRDQEHRDQPTTRYGMPYSVTVAAITPADAVAPTRSVLEALLAGANYPTGEDGRLAMQALVAAHISNKRGGSTVRLDDPEIASYGDLPIA